jgi:hypothetical protein
MSTQVWPLSAACACLLMCSCSQTIADDPKSKEPENPETKEAKSVDRPTESARPSAENSPGQSGVQSKQQALQLSRQSLDNIRKHIRDYSTVIIKRERIDGRLGEPECMLLKVRHKPFSVYGYFQQPVSRKGEEFIYVDGKNDGQLLVHTTGIMGRVMGTVKLSPTGSIAMRGQHYPVTQIGILSMCQRMVDVGEAGMESGQGEVTIRRNVKFNDRGCTCVEVRQREKREDVQFHLTRVFIDDRLHVPIRFEAYDWPNKEGESPGLVEEYTFTDLKLNNGFTDADFDAKNSEYGFP